MDQSPQVRHQSLGYEHAKKDSTDIERSTTHFRYKVTSHLIAHYPPEANSFLCLEKGEASDRFAGSGQCL